MERRILELVSLFKELNLAAVIQFAVLPTVAGAAAAVLAWKSRLGRIRLQRILTQKSGGVRPAWKLVVKAMGRPVTNCKIHVNGKSLEWEGVNTTKLDIGSEGMAMALIPFPVEPNTQVTVKSGAFPVFRCRFGRIEEGCIRN